MSKKDKKLPLYGVGPLYVAVIIAITFAGILLHCLHVLRSGEVGILAVRIVFYVLGALLIASGISIWIIAVLVNKIDDSIINNTLKTTGVYAVVRNPIYTAFLFVCTGELLCCTNWWLLIAPLIFYVYLTVLMICTEEKWLYALFGEEYKAYCKRVNRCIPWFPRKEEV